MKRRQKMSKKKSQSYFQKTAKPHPKNMMGGVMAGPMRGGIRL